MCLYTVELSLEIEAGCADDAAALALLEMRTTPDPMTLDVYSDSDPERSWRRIAVDFRMLEAAALGPLPSTVTGASP